MTGEHSKEIAKGSRFEFGKNWQSFLKRIDEDRILESERSLREMLDAQNLNGKSFLDIGSGSGLFSLAARRLGARVYSFDYDPLSVICTSELRNRYFPDDADWRVEEGSVLDQFYIKSLGEYDVVYSWGVLHHTGDMWKAIENALIPVRYGGKLFLAIYNDQGRKSQYWRIVKRSYTRSRAERILVIGMFFPYFFFSGLAADILRGTNPLRRFSDYKKSRGMSVLTDWFDWLGGYPFEVGKPEQIFDFCRKRGFGLDRLKTCGAGLGNNEFVFTKIEQ